MLTDPPSPPAAPLASLARTARWTFAPATIVRSAIILSFFLYERPYVQRLFTGEQSLALPLWNVPWADDRRMYFVLETVYVGASLLACFRRFVVPACLAAAVASILLVSSDLTYRLQFAFLPGGALLAFALSEVLERKGRRGADLPFVLLLGSVYGFASFHKYWNFQWMKTLLPSSVFGAAGGPLPSLFSSPQNPLLDLVVWTVVPYEALLAVLVVTRRWLKLRLFCVSLFHWLLVLLVPFIWHVSLFMLSLNLYLAALQERSGRERMLRGRKWFVLAGAELVFFLGKSLPSLIPGAAGSFLGAASFASLALFPVFFLFWPFWRSRPEPVAAPSDARPLRGLSAAAVAGFGALVLAFGVSPFLLEKPYSVLSLGWSMFAGGEYREGTYYILRTPASPCFTFPAVYNMIWCEGNDRQLTYLAFRRADLERLERLFERRNCGGPPLQIESAKF